MNFQKPKKRNKRKSWTDIKRSVEDDKFSILLRHRNGWTCENCHRIVNSNSSEGRAAMHNSHYFGRERQGTRFNFDNCDCLCPYCHKQLGSVDKEAYRNFKIKKIGQARYDALVIRANTYHKKDLPLIRLWLKQEFKDEGLNWSTGRVK